MSSHSKIYSAWCGATETLLIVFVVLKLTDNLDWSWFWVLSPMTLPLMFFACLLPFWAAKQVLNKQRVTKAWERENGLHK